ncbi:galactose oxidase [Hymenobacter sp. H14-R3]|uniref:Kelch repeat-containing protein n=1 Tax=Hymenobacter sp. H14-R3 TaxID=3046308 RepID=UPI0024B887A8|nr:galactose oxidase [Hymenobacter sp. H14-R3]MDJ0367213.1 galactose oxidase [Hymenobacter sp. H14-R3]
MKNFPRLAGRLLALLVVLAGLGLSSCKKNNDSATATGNWTRGNAFAGVTRSGSVSFVIGNVAYVGTGVDANNVRYNDFYSYTPATGSWIKLTSMPATARYNAVAFTAGGKGYVGTGYDGVNSLSDFWQFDPTLDTPTTVAGVTSTTLGRWKKVADLTSVAGGTARYGAVAGSVGDVGYVGCGYDGNNQKDFYQYNPATDKWSALASGFPGDKRIFGSTFVVNGQMYVGFGTNNLVSNTDFWSYNPAGSGTWTKLHDLANISNSTGTYDNSLLQRAYASAFTVGNMGYVAVGSLNGAVRTDCYSYDPTLDNWTKMNPFLGAGRTSAVAFGIGTFGYVGTGKSGNTPFDDFWKFDPTLAQE